MSKRLLYMKSRRAMTRERHEDALDTIARLQDMHGGSVACTDILPALRFPMATTNNLQTMLTQLQYSLAATEGEKRRLRCGTRGKTRVWRVEVKGRPEVVCRHCGEARRSLIWDSEIEGWECVKCPKTGEIAPAAAAVMKMVETSRDNTQSTEEA